MGHKIADLYLGIKMDLRQMRKGFKQAGTEIQGFAGRVGAASQGLSMLGKAVTGFSAIVTTALVFSVKQFAKLEQAIANTASVTRATTREMEELERFARLMGETTIYKSHEAADAMYFLGSAGYSVKQVMESLEGTLALAAATQHDLAETTRIVVSNLNAFQMEASDSERMANVFAAAIGSSQATMYKLGESLKYVAPLAAAAGMEIEKVTAALGMLYNAGIHASQAGTAFRMGLARLVSPSDQSREAMRRLGLSAKELSPAFNDLIVILDRLKNAQAGTRKHLAEMREIFGMRAVTAWQIFAREGGQALRKYEESITDTSRAQEMMARQIDTLQGSWRLFTSALQETQNIVGKMLAPMLRAIIDSFRYLLYAINDVNPGLKKFIVFSAAAAAAFGAMVGPATIFIALLPKMSAGLLLLKAAFLTVAPGLTAITLVIGLLVGAFVSLMTHSRRQAAQSKKLSKMIKEHIDKRVEEAQKVLQLSEEFEGLYKTQERNVDQEKRMAEILEEIDGIMPGVIKNTEDYAQALLEVDEAADKATLSLKKFTIMQLEQEASDAGVSIRELRSEMSSLFKNMKEFRPTNIILLPTKELENSLETFRNVKWAIEDLNEDRMLKGTKLDFQGPLYSLVKLHKRLLLYSSDVNYLSKIRKDGMKFRDEEAKYAGYIRQHEEGTLNLSKKKLTNFKEYVRALAAYAETYESVYEAQITIGFNMEEVEEFEERIDEIEAMLEQKRINFAVKKDPEAVTDGFISEEDLATIKERILKLLEIISAGPSGYSKADIKRIFGGIEDATPKFVFESDNSRLKKDIEEIHDLLGKLTTMEADEDVLDELVKKLKEFGNNVMLVKRDSEMQDRKIAARFAALRTHDREDELANALAAADKEMKGKIARSLEFRDQQYKQAELLKKDKATLDSLYTEESIQHRKDRNAAYAEIYANDFENFKANLDKERREDEKEIREEKVKEGFETDIKEFEAETSGKKDILMNFYTFKQGYYIKEKENLALYLEENLEKHRLNEEELILIEQEILDRTAAIKDIEATADELRMLNGLQTVRERLQEEVYLYEDAERKKLKAKLKAFELEKKIYAQKNKIVQQHAQFAGSMAQYMGEMLGASLVGQMDMTRQAFTAMIGLAAAYFSKMLALRMVYFIFQGLWLEAAKMAAGIVAIAAAAAAARALISKTGAGTEIQMTRNYPEAPSAPGTSNAAIGAEIQKTGWVYAHKAERIVPANIVDESLASLRRLPDEEYRDTMGVPSEETTKTPIEPIRNVIDLKTDEVAFSDILKEALTSLRRPDEKEESTIEAPSIEIPKISVEPMRNVIDLETDKTTLSDIFNESLTSLRRLPTEDFRSAMGKTSKETTETSTKSISNVIDLNMNISLDGAMISTNDESAADTFYRNVIQPAEERLKDTLRDMSKE